MKEGRSKNGEDTDVNFDEINEWTRPSVPMGSTHLAHFIKISRGMHSGKHRVNPYRSLLFPHPDLRGRTGREDLMGKCVFSQLYVLIAAAAVSRVYTH